VNRDGRVNAFYSTPAEYTRAKFRENRTWSLKTDDFFPLADSKCSPPPPPPLLPLPSSLL